MGNQQQDIVRSFLDCVAAGDFEAAVDHYAEDVTVHVSAWQDPVVGKEAVRQALQREVGLSDYRYTILHIASADAVTFIEVVDKFKRGDKDITMHWSGVWEIDHEGRITARRDYWDTKEYEAQLA